MKRIKKLADEICDEIKSAQNYAENALSFKAKGLKSWYEKYKEMAVDELKHATYLHDYSTEQINELSKVYTPPDDMEEEWTKIHNKFVEKVAWIKTMLTM